MENSKGKLFLNTLFWGFVLWLWGYVLGIIFFSFIPKEFLGWAIMPFGLVFTFWVLIKKIKRPEFGCYIGLGVIWALMAIILDYLFLVKLLNALDYYKLDVYLYYILTLVIPIVFGIKRFNKLK